MIRLELHHFVAPSGPMASGAKPQQLLTAPRRDKKMGGASSGWSTITNELTKGASELGVNLQKDGTREHAELQ